MAAAARVKAAAAGDQDALNRLLNRRPAEAVVWLATDDALVAAYDEARQAETLARVGIGMSGTDMEQAKAAVAAAREALETSGAVRVVLRSQGRTAYRALIEAHPPREEDHEDIRRQTGSASSAAAWNADTFVPALIALSTVEPAGLTAALVTEMADDGRLSLGELRRLADESVGLYTNSKVADLGK